MLEHQENKKQVFLFENTEGPGGKYTFIDELLLVDYEHFTTPDDSGKDREGIKFQFKSASERSVNREGHFRVAKNLNIPDKTETKGLVTSRVGQGWYRRQLLEKWNNKCAVTGISLRKILIASHIVPWSKATDQERLDPENGILLTPNLDALFDEHLISFDDAGNVMLKEILGKNILDSLEIKASISIKVTEGMKKYLKRHREQFEENN